MNLESNPARIPQGWLKNQVNQFSPKELSQKKSPNIIRVAFGHWFDFFKFAITFLTVFLFVQAILIGVEVLFTDISGIKVIAPLEKLPDEVVAQATEEDTSMTAESVSDSIATEEKAVVAASGPVDPWETKAREYFGNSSDEYPDFISLSQLKLVITLNTIISLLLAIFVFYFHFFYLLSEDGQTYGLRFGKVELFRKDGRELASNGGIGGLGKGPAFIFSIFYLIFLPVFVILSKLQLEYGFLWSFIEGFKTLDLAIAGHDIAMNIVMMLGYWILTVVILVGASFVIGLLFHIIWLLANIIANTLGKDEPKGIIA
jgi:hypothetical protein